MSTLDPRSDAALASGCSNHLRPAPEWVPQTALHYLAHTAAGQPIRALARRAGCHASTVLRQIRKLENRRDDLLVDEALHHLGNTHFSRAGLASGPVARCHITQKEPTRMPTELVPFALDPETSPSVEVLRCEGRRVLRRLAEPGAVLAVAADMDKAVVVRDGAGGTATRTAVVDRAVAQAMALKEWIVCDTPGRVSRYRITGSGRSALAGLLAEAENLARPGQSDMATGAGARFAGPDLSDAKDDGRVAAAPRKRTRYCTNESPLLALARRRDAAGAPFLSPELVAAGERLREDFELAQMGTRVAQNWDRFLTAGVEGSAVQGAGIPRGPEAARARITSALRDLGPGLGDVALRCCCYLEGLELAERRMGWSARSGKIVLRIALQRLRRHYDSLGQEGGLIG
ncbi:MAG: DUF6456 domain-containing protein [Paracoccaceae bacterium]